MELYSRFADYYEQLENRRLTIKQELLLLNNIFRKHKIKTILDLGCGTGLHLTGLKKRGYSVAGIDESRDMLDIAKKNLPAGSLYRMSITEFDLGEKYDCVMSMFGTFDYLTTDDKISKCLSCAKKHLTPDGLLVLHVWNAIPIVQIGKKEVAFNKIIKEEKGTLIRFRGFKILKGEGIVAEIKYAYYVEKDGNKKLIKEKHMMRCFFPEEIKRILKTNGFETLDLKTSFEDKHINYMSADLIVIAKNSK